MSHYSNRPEMVRVDFWKESGKWYGTAAVLWPSYRWDEASPSIHAQFKEALDRYFKSPEAEFTRLTGMRATCLEPYHQHSHPISVVVD